MAKQRRRFVIVLCLLMSGFALHFPNAARADPYNQNCLQGTGVCRPDANPNHWCLGASTNGFASLRQSMQWAITNAHNNTDINTSPMASCSASADVRWQEGGGLSDSLMGVYRCTDWAGASNPQVCYSADVVVNRSAHTYYANHNTYGSDGTPETGEFDLNIDMSSCHELGHQMGLAHHDVAWYASYANDCMRNQWLEAEQANAGWRKYNQHHIDHVNAYY